MKFLKNITRWDWFAIILPALAVSPLLYLQANYLWAKQHLQFFPLAFFAAGWFLYQEGRAENSISKHRFTWALGISIAGILICYAAMVAYSSWLAHLALIILCFGWALARFGNLTVLRLLGICGLLAVTLPPPFNWDRAVVQGLQSLSSVACNRLMDATNILHVQSGNVIEIGSRSLFVEEACSGVDSQYALMAVAGTLLLVGNASLIVSLLTIVTVPIWAILGNLLRIYSIVIGLEFLGIDLSEGTPHTILGLVTFSLAAWAHWSSVQFLNYCELRMTNGESPSVVVTRPVGESKPNLFANQINLPRSSLVFPAVLLVFTPIGFLGVVAYQKRLGPPPSLSKETIAMLPSSTALPMEFLDFRKVGFQTQDRDREGFDGQHSRVWTYEGADSKQLVALDLPFRGWHPLWICYELTGWKNLGTVMVESNSLGEKLEWPFYETKLLNEDGSVGVLHFSQFAENGVPYIYDPNVLFTPERDAKSRLFVSRVNEFLREIRSPPEPLTFQFQVLSKTQRAMSEEEVARYRKLYMEFRESIRRRSLKAFKNLVVS